MPELKKPSGILCPYLRLSSDESGTECSIHENKPTRCREFQCPRGSVRIIGGKLDGGIFLGKAFPDAVIEKMDRLGVLRYSPLVNRFQHNTEPTLEILLPLKKIVDPNSNIPNNKTLELLQVKKFLENLTTEGAHKLVIWIHSILSRDDYYTVRDASKFRPAVNFLSLGFANSHLLAGIYGYASGNIDLPNFEWDLLLSNGGCFSRNPNMEFVNLLKEAIDGRNCKVA
ncbi:MAG: hypothetical protein M1142_03500 [Patescibacteria group bacterium]|nr:hypothetical protein [Patescibacteria group bacterium]